MLGHLRKATRRLKREADVWRAVMAHPRTPSAARWLLGLALAYAVLPIDLIPDWIPVLGYLDDVLIVSGLIFAARRLIPSDVIVECRRKAAEHECRARAGHDGARPADNEIEAS